MIGHFLGVSAQEPLQCGELVSLQMTLIAVLMIRGIDPYHWKCRALVTCSVCPSSQKSNRGCTTFILSSIFISTTHWKSEICKITPLDQACEISWNRLYSERRICDFRYDDDEFRNNFSQGSSYNDISSVINS